MKVIWSPRAVARAIDIAAYIARDRPLAAAQWVDDVFANVAALKDHPRRGRRVPEIGRAAVREVLHGAYRVIYRVDPTRIVVLTVRHGRRAWDPGEVAPEE
ncbi:MAG: type II toxin-antitoxin system RelE/ParE family toxin [Gemmatimonadota bacterium]